MSNKFKALVVDDERLARKGLVDQLNLIQEIEVVGEADCVPAAIEAIKKLKPDVIFLAILMPGQSGFELVEKIDFEGKIIFVTAYDEYALRAFEINALDYLMKPVSKERLENAIDRITSPQKEADHCHDQLHYDDQLFTTIGSKMQFLKINQIKLIQSDGDYTNVNLDSGTHGLVNKTMKEWEERLPENHFVRVHRTSIINTAYIENIEKWFNYSYRVVLKGIEEPVVISRRYAKKLKDLFV
jgi:two-component system LytT family response regulator